MSELNTKELGIWISITKRLGVRIKAARARKGVTQGYIANLIGLSTPHISNIETGNTKLGLPTIIHLANVLDVSVDELLCDNIKRSEKIFQNELADLLKRLLCPGTAFYYRTYKSS
mgnify:CR=1 FL=1